jgi:hypothetical protein
MQDTKTTASFASGFAALQVDIIIDLFLAIPVKVRK